MSSTALEQEVASLLVSALNLEVLPDEISLDMPLFQDEGLGLDSIDALELALAISKQYGVEIKSEDAENKQIFTNLRSLTKHIQQHRTC